jgi:hypothetical protein
MRRLGGCRPDPAHKKTQRDAREFLRSLPPGGPNAFSYRSFEGSQIDQGDIGDCTAAGTAQALSLTSSIQGPAGFGLGFMPSQDCLYKATRSYERALATPIGQALTALTDSGAEPADVMTVLARYGVRPLGPISPAGNFSDTWDAIVNDEIDLLSLETSGQKIITGEYRIQDGTSAADIKAILTASRAPLGIGAFVDSQVLNFTASSPAVTAPNTSDPNGGGHWFTCTGWRTNASGAVEWEFWNTWGRSYGDNGHFFGDDSFMQAAWDRYSWSVR